jgi:hypothetical protein
MVGPAGSTRHIQMTVKSKAPFPSLLFLAGILCLAWPDLSHGKEPVDYVDPKIGTAMKT